MIILALMKVLEAYEMLYMCYLLIILALLKVFEAYVMIYMCYLLIILVFLKVFEAYEMLYMTMKGYSIFPKGPALLEPHHQIV